jgi:hypothetical protein
MPERPSRRQCPDHQRLWRGHCVDQGLDDAWLVALNELGAFDLISICEGHAGQRATSSRSRPHINLRLKSNLLAKAVTAWTSISAGLSDNLSGIFAFDATSAKVELKQQVCLARSEPLRRQDFTVCMQSRQPRVDTTMEPGCIEWFQATIESIKNLDRYMASLLG